MVFQRNTVVVIARPEKAVVCGPKQMLALHLYHVIRKCARNFLPHIIITIVR